MRLFFLFMMLFSLSFAKSYNAILAKYGSQAKAKNALRELYKMLEKDIKKANLYIEKKR